MGYMERRAGSFTSAKSSDKQKMVCLSARPEEVTHDFSIGIADASPFAKGADSSEFMFDQTTKYFIKDKTKEYAEKYKIPPEHHAYLYRLFLEELNRKLHRRRESEHEGHELGCSYTGFIGRTMEICLSHVGSSRAYMIRRGKVTCLTEDHIIGAKVDKMPPPDIYAQLYRFYGRDPWIQIFFKIIKIEPNDIFFICSSDVAAKVDEKTMMQQMMNTPYSPDKTCENIIKIAEERGGTQLAATALYCMDYMGLEMDPHQKTKLVM